MLNRFADSDPYFSMVPMAEWASTLAFSLWMSVAVEDMEMSSKVRIRRSLSSRVRDLFSR